ncbi:hypothetical protein V1525DRAFT_411383 [Lipomyces kononenkoae]|uniref:Uncharacterized protein n=1 Tax=Lipomyces kononenkoae TaxID=34357 RepID=A0ACC3SVZ9_LIPKO
MSERKAVYGAPPPETGRKTWDEEAILQQVRDRAAQQNEARESRSRRAPTPPDAREIEMRRQRLNLDQDLNKVTLVPAGASAVGKKGRGAGFYCEACDLTFKDSLQWVDHLNSKQHLRATGQTETQERATLKDVQDRLEWLRRKRDEENQGQMYDIKKRIAERQRIEEEERRMRREKRMQKRREKRAQAQETTGHEDDDMDEDRRRMEDMMGIRGFGSTKVK